MQSDHSDQMRGSPCDSCQPCGSSVLACPEPAQPGCYAVAETRRRPERLFDANKLPRYVCGPQACKVFGGHDLYPDEPVPEVDPAKACKTRRRKRKTSTSSLGSPVGVVKSTITVRTVDLNGKGSDEMNTQRFATYLKAFAMIYLTPENEWDTSIIDALLREGQLLYTHSMSTPHRSDDEPVARIADTGLGVYSEEELKINREFPLKGFVFGVELSSKYVLTGHETGIMRHTTVRTDIGVDQLGPALKGFFSRFKYCLMRISSWYVLIWRTRSIFFVFDFYGRRPSDFMSDREGEGVAMLICLKSLNNVLHLLKNLSNIGENEPIQLREMKVVKLSGPDGKTVSRDFARRSHQYVVVSPDYAYLTCALYLNRQQRDPLRSRSALPIGVAALIASKIDHPATWNRNMLEKIICFGVNMCLNSWKQCQYSRIPIEMEHFPNEMKLGQFLTGYTLTPRVAEGVWKCVPNYTLSELVIALEKCFENNMTNLLIQIGPQIYAFWRKHSYFYLLDPYRHRMGGALMSVEMSTKSASVRMFRSMDGFMGMFTQILLEYTQTSPFQIHSLKVNRLEYVDKPEGRSSLIEEVDSGDDVVSLNETICFNEEEYKCKKLLGENTEEDEEEDVGGALQLEAKEPKSDSEQSAEDLEEEEGGMEGMDEYESSSSGGDDDDRPRRQGGGGGGVGTGHRQLGGSDRTDERSSNGSKSGGTSSKDGHKGTSGSGNKNGRDSGDTMDSNINAIAAATVQPIEHRRGRQSLLQRLLSVFTMCRPRKMKLPAHCTHVFRLADEQCNYTDMQKELRAAFKYASRLEVFTPWASYDIYRARKVKKYDSVYICQEYACSADGHFEEEEYFFSVDDMIKYMIGVRD